MNMYALRHLGDNSRSMALRRALRLPFLAHPPRCCRLNSSSARKALPSVAEALRTVKSEAKAKFDESLDIAVQLGVDPRKPGQNIRGMLRLPHGTGKVVRVAVFAKEEALVEAAREAGADVVGSDDLIASVQKGVLEFDQCIATPDMMPKLGKIARVLGPRGLMPNPKLGTVTANVSEGVQVNSPPSEQPH